MMHYTGHGHYAGCRGIKELRLYAPDQISASGYPAFILMEMSARI
jgi:hypothetical protein